METIKTLYPKLKNFKDSELTREPVPLSLVVNIIPSIAVVQEIRTFLGLPITIHSGYRSEEYNSKIPGSSTNSMHIQFNAIDFTPEGFDSKRIAKLYKEIERGKFQPVVSWRGRNIQVTPKMMGLGLYNTFIHIDTRGLLGKDSARWDYRSKS